MALINATWKVTHAGVVLLDFDDFTEGEPQLERAFISDRVAGLGSDSISYIGRKNVSHTATFRRAIYFANDDEARTFERQHIAELSAAPADCLIEWLRTGLLDTLQGAVITGYRSHVENNFFMADYTLSAGGRLTTGVITPPGCVPTITDSYFDGDYILDHVDDIEEGVSFMASVGGPVTRVSFWLAKVSSATGNLTAKLYEHTGTYGGASSPGALLATSNSIDVSTLSTSATKVDFGFSSTVSLVAGTPYIVIISFPTVSISNYYFSAYTPAPPDSHPGIEIEGNGSTWNTDAGENHCFEVEVCVPPSEDDACWRFVNLHDPCGLQLQVKNASNVWETVWTGRASS